MNEQTFEQKCDAAMSGLTVVVGRDDATRMLTLYGNFFFWNGIAYALAVKHLGADAFEIRRKHWEPTNGKS